MKILPINTCFLLFGSLLSHVEVASFLKSSGKSNGLHSSCKLTKHHKFARINVQSSDLSESESVKKDAILSESVMNKRLIEMGSEPIDFELLKKTIAEWSRPLPLDYFSQPLVLVGPSGVGKGRLVKALLKDYKRFFSKIVTHTTRGLVKH
jgi:Guanylate kinase